MIEIEKTATTSKKEERTKIKGRKKTHPVSGKGETFTGSLKKTFAFEFAGTVEELTEELREQEKKFLDMQSAYELNRYKSLVQKILKLVLDEGFHIKRLKSKRQNKDPMFMVQVINEKLIGISQYITNRANKAFNLLKEIEEIRGMLLDLLS